MKIHQIIKIEKNKAYQDEEAKAKYIACGKIVEGLINYLKTGNINNLSGIKKQKESLVNIVTSCIESSAELKSKYGNNAQNFTKEVKKINNVTELVNMLMTVFNDIANNSQASSPNNVKESLKEALLIRREIVRTTEDDESEDDESEDDGINLLKQAAEYGFKGYATQSFLDLFVDPSRYGFNSEEEILNECRKFKNDCKEYSPEKLLNFFHRKIKKIGFDHKALLEAAEQSRLRRLDDKNESGEPKKKRKENEDEIENKNENEIDKITKALADIVKNREADNSEEDSDDSTSWDDDD